MNELRVGARVRQKGPKPQLEGEVIAYDPSFSGYPWRVVWDGRFKIEMMENAKDMVVVS